MINIINGKKLNTVSRLILHQTWNDVYKNIRSAGCNKVRKDTLQEQGRNTISFDVLLDGIINANANEVYDTQQLNSVLRVLNSY